jgi:hypothetical protein
LALEPINDYQRRKGIHHFQPWARLCLEVRLGRVFSKDMMG